LQEQRLEPAGHWCVLCRSCVIFSLLSKKYYILFNAIASTTPKWRTFNLLRWLKLLNLFGWNFVWRLWHWILMIRAVFWVILPCKIIVDRRFRGAYCLHHPWSSGSITQKTALNIILAAVRTWNLTHWILFTASLCRESRHISSSQIFLL
jgi:hypothetical protein